MRDPFVSIASYHGMWWLESFRLLQGLRRRTTARASLRFLRTGTRNLAEYSGAPIPLDPYPLFDSGETTIDRVFRICMQVVVEGRDLTV